MSLSVTALTCGFVHAKLCDQELLVSMDPSSNLWFGAFKTATL